MILDVVESVSLDMIDDNEKSVVFTSGSTLWQKQAMWESLVVVASVHVQVVHVIAVLSIQCVQGALVELSHGLSITNDVLEIAGVSLDDVLSVIQLNNELVQFHKVVAVVIQLLLIVDAWSEEDSDDTILVLLGFNINGDSEFLSVHTTGASNNIHAHVEVVEISLIVVDLLAMSIVVVVVSHVAV